MKLKLSFDDWIRTISLDDTRSSKIQSAHNAVREFLEKDEEIKKKYYETFLQGSYVLCTAVRPQGDGEYDVDVILSLNLHNGQGGLLNPDIVIDWIAKRLRSSDRYKDKVNAKPKCIRINYSDGFHMDIVPAHCSGDTDGVLKVPPDWKKSHPKAYRKWCRKKHESSNNFFYAIIKMLKWWRNIHCGDCGSPKSILLTTMIGNHIVTNCDSVDETLVNTMEEMNKYFQANILVPEVVNPTLDSEILSKTWTITDYISFKDKFKLATEKARQALDEKDETKTIEFWNSPELFDGTFPKTIRGLDEEAKKFGEMLAAGELYASSLGSVGIKSTSQSINIPSTKFYGQ